MKFFLSAIVLLTGVSVFAQDTTKKRAVTVTSTFKPVLKEAAKINFNATPPNSDSTKPRLLYEIPNQNLLFPYQPGSLKPLALQIDTGGVWDNSSYVKVGYGTLQTPFVQAGFSVGDGHTAGLNLYAQHISSKGKRDFQDFKNSKVELNGFYKMCNNISIVCILLVHKGISVAGTGQSNPCRGKFAALHTYRNTIEQPFTYEPDHCIAFCIR